MAGFTDLITTVRDRFSTNLATSFSSLSAQQWIRLIAVAGAYMLLRPYIIKLGARVQMRQHESDEADLAEEAAAVAAGKKAPLSANDLRGTSAAAKLIPDEDDDDDDDDEDEDDDEGAGKGTATGARAATDWGKTARRRQRRMLRQLLAAHEQQLADAQADEEDKDIEEFLED
ncbi:DUF1531 domain containing protein [Niveomyces insectorum RCEF 264]|uniref:DUF1531 domain containing protein n=1 Tax=Niveomyces insectorum RCEF 264 TaxID=1081102 RepID=A0A162JCS4_9HYPO|nr:DUF1531 domain containing protein [Niveomyces insectorum RCEF 264]